MVNPDLERPRRCLEWNLVADAVAQLPGSEAQRANTVR
jgi:hypothetical protein